MKRALVAAALALVGCNDQTGVMITFDAPGLVVDTLDVYITVDGDPAARHARRSLGPEPTAIHGKRLQADLDLARAAGATVEVTATLAGATVGQGATPNVAVIPHRLTAASVRLAGDGVDLDMAGNPDAGGDLAAPPGSDLATVPVAVSHLPGGVPPGSAAVTVTTSIDTTNFRIDGNAPPAGASFGDMFGFAVLSVATLDVTGSNVRVTGSRALIIVADDRITISGTLDAGGHGVNDGPGARASGAGLGGIGDYLNGTGSSSGGGGGGFAGSGGVGAPYSGATGPAGTAGQSYGDPAITTLQGGSRGGDSGCKMSPSGIPYTVGGGGGGALQLTARNRVTVAAGGRILVGGGGGGAIQPGGCVQNGGGGGGAGGAIFLEAAALTVDGSIHAAGGGGGAGTRNGVATDGDDASDVCPTAGGPGGAQSTAGGSGACSGNGGNGATPADQFAGGGGGGGAPGRIVLRAHVAPTFGAAQVAPAPKLITF